MTLKIHLNSNSTKNSAVNKKNPYKGTLDKEGALKLCKQMK